MSEVYYPRVDVANVRDLQLRRHRRQHVHRPRDPATSHRTRLLERVRAQLPAGRTPTRTAATGSSRPTRPTRAARRSSSTSKVTSLDGGTYRSYALYDPSLANSGKHDAGSTRGQHAGRPRHQRGHPGGQRASRASRRSPPPPTASPGQRRADRPRADHRLNWRYTRRRGRQPRAGRQARPPPATASPARPSRSASGPDHDQARLTAGGSLDRGFAKASAAYDAGWCGYLDSLDRAPRSVRGDGDLRTQYNVAAMTLKAHEDKTYRGANIASLSVPWGEAINADEAGVGGYHLVWARDLYQVATAQLAAGDEARGRSLAGLPLRRAAEARRLVPAEHAARRHAVLGQPAARRGRVPDRAGRPARAPRCRHLGAREEGRGLPRRARPRHAAGALGGGGRLLAEHPRCRDRRADQRRRDRPRERRRRLGHALHRGRRRLAAPREGLDVHDDRPARRRLVLHPHRRQRQPGRRPPARDQQRRRHVRRARRSSTAGFLDLVRLGVLPADDPAVIGSLAELDSTIKVDTPHGPMWYRYNHDGYGEKADGSPYDGTGVGRLWPLLSGERGEYELAAGRPAARSCAPCSGRPTPAG